MNNKFAQLVYIVHKIDRRHIQLAFFALTLAATFLVPCPSDGGVGPF